MKLHATGDTQIGELVLFWPELLPADFDEQFHDTPEELIDKLRNEGKLVLILCDLSGEFHVGLFVDEAVPGHLEQHCTLGTKIEALTVAGDGYLCGGEYIFRKDRSLLDKQPQMGSAVQIPTGTYFAEVFITEVPDEVYETWLREQAGERAQRFWWAQTWFASIGIVAMMVFVGCLFFGTRQLVIASAIASAVLLGIAWIMSRTAWYQRVQQARSEYDVAFPDYVIRLRTSKGDSSR